MGKKRIRKKYVSRGLRRNVSSAALSCARRGVSEIDKMMNKVKAWKAGKTGWVTIKNPNKSQTNMPFIKVSYETFFGGTYKQIMDRFAPAGGE